MPIREQSGRIAVLTTPLGQDVLVLTKLEATEGLSTLFEIRVTAESDQESVDLKPLIGAACSVSVDSYGNKRHFHGLAVEAQWSGGAKEAKQYVLILRPTLWLLTQTSDCRIFKGLNVPDIIKEVFQQRGLTDYTFSLSESYEVLEYCVQYNETDYALVCRLMEQYGLYYFFKHTEAGHTLHVVDSSSGHLSVDEGANIPYSPGAEGYQIGDEHLREFTSERCLRTGKVTIVDYDFMQPNAEMTGAKSETTGYQHGDLEAFHFPGKYPRKGTTDTKSSQFGTTFAQVRLAAVQALDQRRYAEGDAASLFPGGHFKFAQAEGGGSAHPEAGDYLVVAARHEFAWQAYSSGGAGSGPDLCRSSLELQQNDRVFRAPLTTPRPVIHGPQTAVVTSDSGKEIDVDKYGRVLLNFHWDRDKTVSRRVRVAQIWSGGGWGGQFIPRPPQEVVVEFLDGDPDRPLIVGTVYNGTLDWPYQLPANDTMSGVKSSTSKGGGGYNELMFDDKKGSEQIRMHAQRDHNVTVLNGESWTIGESFEKSQKGDPSRTTTIKKGDDKLTLEQGNLQVTVDQGDHTTTVSTGKHETTVSSGNQTDTVSLGDQTVDISAGNQTVTVGKSISVSANLKIEFTVGASKLTIDQSGVTIKAPMVQIEASALLKAQGAIVQVNADGVLMLKGAVTMIN